jgi:4-diphosphocytidyl-2-C-methyl-D-erythritol kinase
VRNSFGPNESGIGFGKIKNQPQPQRFPVPIAGLDQEKMSPAFKSRGMPPDSLRRFPGPARLLAPAKINLFLEILGRRRDGYHTLSSLFQEISLADELTVSLSPERSVSLACKGADLPLGADNLAVRAAQAFQGRFGRRPKEGYKILLKKRIPVGAGLGGGSSDAAAVLKACWRLRTGKPLMQFPWRSFLPLSRRLGADVSFFLRGGSAHVEGIGHRIRPLAEPKKAAPAWFVLIFPRVSVSTKWVYQNLRFPLTNQRSIHKLKKGVLSGHAVSSWAPYLFNRLEEVVLPRVPVVARAKKALIQAGCRAALMSGSGSSVFGLGETEAKCREIAGRLRSDSWDIWTVHSQSLSANKSTGGRPGTVFENLVDRSARLKRGP